MALVVELDAGTYPHPSAAHEVMQDPGALSSTTVVTSSARIRAGSSIAHVVQPGLGYLSAE